MKKSELLREHFTAIVDKMVEMDAENRKYQMDLYIYPDGELSEFVNVGGNSWLNDDHITVWSVNNEYSERGELTEEEIKAVCEENRSGYEDTLNAIISEAEKEEQDDEEWRKILLAQDGEVW